MEYLDFTVTEECNVLLKCKVRKVTVNVCTAVSIFEKMKRHKLVLFLRR